MSIIREACVENFDQAKDAFEKGASRLELCDNLAVGGTTPSFGVIKESIEKLSLPISVMIRPRKGNFVYTPEEIEIMIDDIYMCENIGAKSVVFGCLTNEKQIDLDTLQKLCTAAENLEKVFHMAIDDTKDTEKQINLLIEHNINRILTKGKAKTAFEGKDTLKKWQEMFQDKITILAGGGVTKDNYQNLVDYTHITQVHGTKII